MASEMRNPATRSASGARGGVQLAGENSRETNLPVHALQALKIGVRFGISPVIASLVAELAFERRATR